MPRSRDLAIFFVDHHNNDDNDTNDYLIPIISDLLCLVLYTHQQVNLPPLLTHTHTHTHSTTAVSVQLTAAQNQQCPPGVPIINCFVNPCTAASCPNIPTATCRADYCGGCNARWYVGGGSIEVTRNCTSKSNSMYQYLFADQV